jgi:hypothetical protein
MKLPKRLIERRDALIAKQGIDADTYDIKLGYNQGVEDLMSEVQGLIDVIRCSDVFQAHQVYEICNNCDECKALSKWRAYLNE